MRSSPSTPACRCSSATPRPWQDGSKRNTNGLLRQYFPRKVVDFHAYTRAGLDAVAAELHARPRKTLDFMTPSEKYNDAVAPTR